jgi:phosphoribosylamine---glycine ligase
MNILIIGSGAREHILAKCLKLHDDVQIFNIGTHINPGIKALAEDITLLLANQETQAIQQYAQQQQIDFVWIGPEAPLEAGVADALWQVNIPVIGPKKALAQLETSKGFTRQLQNKYQIPGALQFKYFKSLAGAADYLKTLGADYVIKADGLMGGKGVKLSGEHLASHKAALDYCQEILNAGQNFVIEEKLVGMEFSLLCFCDGKTLKPMPIAHDHKRAFNKDLGPNTGGMGVYTDVDGLLPFVTEKEVAAALEISKATIKALQTEVRDTYIGIVYGSFMVTRQGVKLIEFNARFGDPEVINLLSLLETDLVSVSIAMLEQRLAEIDLRFKKQASVCKYAVPNGYPDQPVKGECLQIGSLPEGVKCFYASVAEDTQGLKLLGSRAVVLVALADTIPAASLLIEAAMQKMTGPVFYRSDIGSTALLQERLVQRQARLGGGKEC